MRLLDGGTHKAMKTYYDDLQVARSAAPEVIAAAYRSLSMKYHPDRNVGDARSEALMKAINEAYAVLSDSVKRKAHDDWIAARETKLGHSSASRSNVGNMSGAVDFGSRGKRFTTSAEKASRPPKAATRDRLSKYSIPTNLRKFAALYIVIVLLLVFWIASLLDTEATHDYAAAEQWARKEDAPASIEANPILEAMEAGHLQGETDGGEVSLSDAIRMSKVRPQGEADGGEGEGASESSGPWERYQNNRGNSQPSADERRAISDAAPNGLKWPSHAGYVQGYERLNTQGRSRVTIDNSRNSGAAFVKLVDISQVRPHAVRSVFVPAYESYTITSISPGVYDIRYKDLQDGGFSRSESFSLSETREINSIRYSDMKITLYKVKNGNMETYSINENEFLLN